jgi:hypothetical protein
VTAIGASRLSHHTMLGHSLDVAACALVLLDPPNVLASSAKAEVGQAASVGPIAIRAARPLDHDLVEPG